MIKKIDLPSGYSVELKDSIGIGLFRDYQKLLLGDMVMDSSVDKNKEIKIDVNIAYKGQDFILENTLVAIYDKEGNKLEPVLEKFKDLSIEDGNKVYEEIDKIVAGFTLNVSEKKSGKVPV